jgi:hypothetical protein
MSAQAVFINSGRPPFSLLSPAGISLGHQGGRVAARISPSSTIKTVPVTSIDKPIQEDGYLGELGFLEPYLTDYSAKRKRRDRWKKLQQDDGDKTAGAGSSSPKR